LFTRNYPFNQHPFVYEFPILSLVLKELGDNILGKVREKNLCRVRYLTFYLYCPKISLFSAFENLKRGQNLLEEYPKKFASFDQNNFLRYYKYCSSLTIDSDTNSFCFWKLLNQYLYNFVNRKQKGNQIIHLFRHLTRCFTFYLKMMNNMFFNSTHAINYLRIFDTYISKK
jgi:hypothetical protein